MVPMRHFLGKKSRLFCKQWRGVGVCHNIIWTWKPSYLNVLGENLALEWHTNWVGAWSCRTVLRISPSALKSSSPNLRFKIFTFSATACEWQKKHKICITGVLFEHFGQVKFAEWSNYTNQGMMKNQADSAILRKWEAEMEILKLENNGSLPF